jgi:hypothetical protein
LLPEKPLTWSLISAAARAIAVAELKAPLLQMTMDMVMMGKVMATSMAIDPFDGAARQILCRIMFADFRVKVGNNLFAEQHCRFTVGDNDKAVAAHMTDEGFTICDFSDGLVDELSRNPDHLTGLHILFIVIICLEIVKVCIKEGNRTLPGVTFPCRNRIAQFIDRMNKDKIFAGDLPCGFLSEDRPRSAKS